MAVEKTSLEKGKICGDKIYYEVEQIDFGNGGYKRTLQVFEPFKWQGKWCRGSKINTLYLAEIMELMKQVDERHNTDSEEERKGTPPDPQEEIPF